MFCCVSAISLDITFQALRAVRGICVKVVRPRAVMSLACGGRAAAHDTRHARREAYTFSGAAQQRPFTPRRPVNAETQNSSRKTLLLYIMCRAVWTVVYGAEDTGLV
eukprot:scaffold46277_cov40-Phaeocystis_antarctica.AAC.2